MDQNTRVAVIAIGVCIVIILLLFLCIGTSDDSDDDHKGNVKVIVYSNTTCRVEVYLTFNHEDYDWSFDEYIEGTASKASPLSETISKPRGVVMAELYVNGIWVDYKTDTIQEGETVIIRFYI